MNINFLTGLIAIRPNKPKTQSMPQPSKSPRPLIVKLDARHYRLDPFHENLVAGGFQVVRGSTLKEGLKLTRRVKPDLILVFDNPRAGMDGSEWLSIQHSDPHTSLAMIPLVIVADRRRVSALQVHELPGRVRVVALPIEMDDLAKTIRDILALSDF